MKLKRAYFGDYEKPRKLRKRVITISVAVVICTICLICISIAYRRSNMTPDSADPIDFAIPSYEGAVYIEINGNTPFFQNVDMTTEVYQQYSPLDSLGRCGPAISCLGRETMPTDERGTIGMIKPSGWHTVRYDDLIEDKYLYNRCHLIAYKLSGENDNALNLITGTRYFNKFGMLPFEIKVANYIRYTGNHVIYRVTPIFEGKNLVASGVLMEAQSVEDHGAGILFNVYVFNIQPGIEIDYLTGDSKRIPQP
ncbi:MAG: DNA/RNA non-specific endonuclease [Eubacteriales bacterium]|nr:DNA/RNA non-specific endonuclease [Eubacteriales bacterium]